MAKETETLIDRDMKRYGFFLGSFDPPHLGHVKVVEKVLRENLVDYVIVVPAPQNPWKKHKPASLAQRYWMCYETFKDIDKVRVTTGTDGLWNEDPLLENGQGGKKVSYSYKQLQVVLDQFSKPLKKDMEKYLVCGTDVYEGIKYWKNGEWVLENFKPLLIDRPGYSEEADPEIPEISSSEIRELIGKGESLPWGFLKDEVVRRIKEFKIYG